MVLSCEMNNGHSAKATIPTTARTLVNPTLTEVATLAPLFAVLEGAVELEVPVVEELVDEFEAVARARVLNASKLLGPDSTALMEKTIPCEQ